MFNFCCYGLEICSLYCAVAWLFFTVDGENTYSPFFFPGQYDLYSTILLWNEFVFILLCLLLYPLTFIAMNIRNSLARHSQLHGHGNSANLGTLCSCITKCTWRWSGLCFELTSMGLFCVIYFVMALVPLLYLRHRNLLSVFGHLRNQIPAYDELHSFLSSGSRQQHTDKIRIMTRVLMQTAATIDKTTLDQCTEATINHILRLTYDEDTFTLDTPRRVERNMKRQYFPDQHQNYLASACRNLETYCSYLHQFVRKQARQISEMEPFLSYGYDDTDDHPDRAPQVTSVMTFLLYICLAPWVFSCIYRVLLPVLCLSEHAWDEVGLLQKVLSGMVFAFLFALLVTALVVTRSFWLVDRFVLTNQSDIYRKHLDHKFLEKVEAEWKAFGDQVRADAWAQTTLLLANQQAVGGNAMAEHILTFVPVILALADVPRVGQWRRIPLGELMGSKLIQKMAGELVDPRNAHFSAKRDSKEEKECKEVKEHKLDVRIEIY